MRNKSAFLIGIINKVKQEARAGTLTRGGGGERGGGERGGGGGAADDSGGCTILVGGLTERFEKDKLKNIFSQFGDVRDVRIAREAKYD